MGLQIVGHDWSTDLNWHLSTYLSSTYPSICPTFYREKKKMIIKTFRIAVCWAVGWCVQSLSCVQLFATLWTIARQATLSTGFSRQAHLSCCDLPCPHPADLPDPGMESVSLMSSALAGGFFVCLFFTTKLPGKPRRVTERETQQRSFTYIPWDLPFPKFFERCAGIWMII